MWASGSAHHLTTHWVNLCECLSSLCVHFWGDFFGCRWKGEFYPSLAVYGLAGLNSVAAFKIRETHHQWHGHLSLPVKGRVRHGNLDRMGNYLFKSENITVKTSGGIYLATLKPTKPVIMGKEYVFGYLHSEKALFSSANSSLWRVQ